MAEALVKTDIIVPDQIIPKGYRKSYQSCRAMGHEWQHIPDLADHPSYRYIKGLVSECLGCGTVRTRWVHANGRKFGNKYEYPDDYQISKRTYPRVIRSPKAFEWRENYVSTLGFREETIKNGKK